MIDIPVQVASICLSSAVNKHDALGSASSSARSMSRKARVSGCLDGTRQPYQAPQYTFWNSYSRTYHPRMVTIHLLLGAAEAERTRTPKGMK